jgi:hypothetical protein
MFEAVNKHSLRNELAEAVAAKVPLRVLPGERRADFVLRIVRAYHDEQDAWVAERWRSYGEDFRQRSATMVDKWSKAIRNAKKPQA